MKMKMLLAATLASSLLVACSKDDSKKKGGDGGNTVITDKSKCQGSTPGGLSLFGTVWIESSIDEATGARLDQSIIFQQNSAEMQLTGSKNGKSATARAQTTATIGQNRIEITSSASDEATFPLEDGKTFTVSIDLRPMVMNYTFVGPCLKLMQEGGSGEMLLVPRGF